MDLQTLRRLLEPQTDESLIKLAIWAVLKEGLITNVLNLKVAIFYLAFLPQFINPNDPVLIKSLLLVRIHNLLSIIWLGGLVVVIGPGKHWIEKQSVQLRLSRTSGV